jgi:hypothetical protein
MGNKLLLEKITEGFDKASDYRKAFEDRWKRYYGLYRSRAKPQDDETRANIFVPEVFTAIETLTPRLVSNFLNSSKPAIRVFGREESDMANAVSAEKLLAYQFEKMEMPLKLISFYKQALLYGTSVGKVYWDYRVRKGRNGEDVVVYDDPAFEVLDVFDFYIDPGATGIDDARYCIHRKFLSWEDLKKRESDGIYRNVEKLKNCGGYVESASVGDREPGDSSDPLEERTFEILEYWEDDRVVTVGERSVILRDVPNPFDHGKKPFVQMVFVPVPFEFYGIGVIEPIEGLQMELNTKRNQRLDNVNMVINRMWLLQRGAMDDLRQLYSRPGGVIVVNDINGLQPLPSPDVTSSSYNEEEKIKSDIQNTSGISDYIRGMISSDKQTATEVRIKSEQGANRFDFNFKLMAEMGLKRIASLVIQLNQQFVESDRTIRIIGEKGADFRKITPAEIQGNFDLIPNVDPLRIQEMENRQQILTLYSTLINNPIIDKNALTKKLLESFDVGNTGEFMMAVN